MPHVLPAFEHDAWVKHKTSRAFGKTEMSNIEEWPGGMARIGIKQ